MAGRIARLALVGLVVLAVTTQGMRVAEALVPAAAIPVLAPSVTGWGAVAGTSGALTAGGAAAAGVTCAVACPIAIGLGLGAGAAYLGWRAWDAQEWSWEGDADPDAEALATGGDGGPDAPQSSPTHHGVTLHDGRHRDDGATGETVEGAPVKLGLRVTQPRAAGSPSYPTSYLLVEAEPSTDARTVTGTYYQGHTGDTLSFGFSVSVSGNDPMWSGMSHNWSTGSYLVTLKVNNGTTAESTSVDLDAWMTAPGDALQARLRSTATFMDEAGNTRTETEYSPWYTDGTDPLPMLPGHIGTELEQLVDVDVARESADPAIVPDATMVEWELPAEHLDPAHQYADCLGGGPPCRLTLTRVLTDGSRLVCNVPDSPCVGWASDPDVETNYDCMWGTYTLGVSQCAALSRSYEPDTLGETTTQTETEPVLNPQPSGLTGILTKLFVPTKSPELAADIADSVGDKTPFAQLGSAVGWVGDLGEVGQACWVVAVEIEGNSYGPLPEPGCTGMLYDWLQDNRTLFAIVWYSIFLVPLLWWAWRTYAPGTTSAA